MDENLRRELLKVSDTLGRARLFHVFRDQMNAETHLAKEVRFSPLTSALITAQDNLDKLIQGE